MRFGRALSECVSTAWRSRLDPRGVGMRLAGVRAPSAASLCEVVYGTATAEVVTWTPPVVVHAHGFTAYLDAPADPHAAWDAPGARTLDILVECRRLTVRPGRPPAAEQGCADSRVKLTDFCRPVAWRPGNPLGILATCSPDHMTKLAEAFARHELAIDDDVMDIEQITTVKVEGTPRQLLHSESVAAIAFDEVDEAGAGAAASVNGSGMLCSDLRRLADDDVPLEVAMHGLSRDCRASGTDTVAGNVRRFRGVVAPSAGAAGGNASISSLSLSEAMTWSSSSLDDVENLCAADDAMSPAFCSADGSKQSALPPQPLQMKPPNILVYTGSMRPTVAQQGSARNTASADDHAFENVASLLGTCLLPYSYAVYHLDSVEAANGRTPWADNCAALFLTPEVAVPADVDGFVTAVIEYFQSGGTIISLCSDIDRRFVHVSDYALAGNPSLQMGAAVHVTDVHTTDGLTFKACLSSSHYLRDPQCYIPDTDLRIAACDAADNPVAIEIIGREHRGHMVLLRVHAEMGAPAAVARSRSDGGGGNGDQQLFREFVDAGSDRLTFLQSLLQNCGLRVSNQKDDSHELQPTPCVLLATDSKLRDDFVDAVRQCKQLRGQLDADGGDMLRHADVEYDMRATAAAASLRAAAVPGGFDWPAYTGALTSRRFGHVVLYQQVSCTTQALLEPFMLNLPDHVCAAAIATRQTKGKGRSGNSWLSPPGCAMATLHVRAPLHSPLGQAPAFIQMVPAVATAMAVRTLPGYENVDIKVKWPNDIYYGSRAKLGGVLVQSTLMGSEFHALVGFGVNVSNQHPTCCINDAVALAAAEGAAGGDPTAAGRPLLPPLTVEVVLARVISFCEHLVDIFQQDKSAFLKLYYEHWLHAGGSTVLVQEHPDAAAADAAGPGRPAPPPPTEGRIEGVDEAGYLVVKTADGRRLSLQPDGNSFDIMRNLIVRKRL